MNEGKDLLIKILNKKLSQIKEIDKEKIYFENINLIELYKKITQDISEFANCSDNLISTIVSPSSANFEKKLRQIRDLYLGKRDYNLKINITKDYEDQLNKFIAHFKNYLETSIPSFMSIESDEEEIIKIQNALRNKEIISNFAFIEKLVVANDYLNVDNNMLLIMKYLNAHNLEILKTPKKNAPEFDIHFIKRPKLDEEIKEILTKLEINYKDLPNYLIGELRKCDSNSFINNYRLIKRNKAEDYGILHIIPKENNLAKLIILLYATENSIKGVVDSLRSSNGIVDISLLKIVISSIFSSLLEKSNDYFQPKYRDYSANMILLKELNINYKALINKCPLFMLTNNEVLTYTLNYLEKYGANSKKIINRCYKTLTINPAILIENIDIMQEMNIDLASFFSSANYNLLKCDHLKNKVDFILTKAKIDLSDFELVNKMIVANIYKQAKDSQSIWSD